jgi:predicted ATPase/DNA-binding winged helix-turn-helix (wHTH) protein
MTEHLKTISFGRCILFPATRIILGDDQPIKLGARALDLLLCLARSRGEVVSQDDLMKAAWPNATVGDNTLRVQIKNLRAALVPFGAEHSIVNRSGRGYEFTGFTEAVAHPEHGGTKTGGTSSQLIGRASLVETLIGRLAKERCITLVGPGGIGKTAIAREVRDKVAPLYEYGTHFVDLSNLEDERLVASSLARSLGLSIAQEDSTASILHFLKGKETLIVFDTCERLVSAVAALTDAIVATTTRVDILATSREALRIRNERIVEVPPLNFPAQSLTVSNENLFTYSATHLFLERAAATGFVLRDVNEASAICQLCAKLDGLPLAIELAAGRAREFGVVKLLHQLDDRFTILAEGFRTAVPRQRALRATLDWSYDLLSLLERRLLDRISVLRGEFSLEAAIDVAQSTDLPGGAIAHTLGLLVQKSLVMTCGPAGGWFCLLDTTRAYARENLKRAKEEDTVSRRHAEYCLRELVKSQRQPDNTAAPIDFDDLRAAFEWAFTEPDGGKSYLELVVAAVPSMVEHSLIDECRRHAVTAISLLSADDRTSLSAMQLHAALGGAYMNSEGAGDRTFHAWREVYRISGKLNNIQYRLQSLWGLWVDRRNRGHYCAAFVLAKRYARLARKLHDPVVERNVHRMLGISYFFAGDFDQARKSLDRVLLLSEARRQDSIRTFQFDPVMTARCFIAQILWFQGYPDQAYSLASRNVKDALELNHAGTLSYALIEAACPISLNIGDLESAERFGNLVVSRTAGRGLEIWRTLGECFLGVVALRRGDPKGVGLTEEALKALRRQRLGPFFTRALGEYALFLARNGQTEEAWAAISEATERAVRNGEGWCLPELLRIRGEVTWARSGDLQAVETDLVESLALATSQNALGWKLRTATSLARLYQARMELHKARRTLVPVLDFFREGFVTTDVQTAVGLVDQIDFEMKLERLSPSY